MSGGGRGRKLEDCCQVNVGGRPFFAAAAALPATQFQLGYITTTAFTAGTSSLPSPLVMRTTPIKGEAGKKDKA